MRPSPPTVHVPVVSDTTEVAPSPLVATLAVKLPSSVAPPGTLEMLGALGVAWSTVKPWLPDDEMKFWSPWYEAVTV